MSRRAALKSIGIFDLGIRTVQVFVDPKSHNANFSFVHEDTKGQSRMVIGIKDERFRDAWNNAIHEGAEMAFTEMRLRYTPSPEVGNDNGAYFFVMDHTAFSEAMARLAVFTNFLYPVLKQVHEKFHAKRKSHRRR